MHKKACIGSLLKIGSRYCIPEGRCLLMCIAKNYSKTEKRFVYFFINVGRITVGPVYLHTSFILPATL